MNGILLNNSNIPYLIEQNNIIKFNNICLTLNLINREFILIEDHKKNHEISF